LRVYGFLGFTLIEVLISLFIFSFILLGFNGVLLQTKRQAYAEYLYSIATQQIITMIERLNALGDANGIDDQLTIWNVQNKLLLPNGVGVIEGSYPSYTVTLYWGKKSFNCDVNCIRKNVTV
jgi:type IV pilus assembly protein PilV